MSDVYSFKDYDKHLCLKPPVEFWLAVGGVFPATVYIEIFYIPDGQGWLKDQGREPVV